MAKSLQIGTQGPATLSRALGVQSAIQRQAPLTSTRLRQKPFETWAEVLKRDNATAKRLEDTNPQASIKLSLLCLDMLSWCRQEKVLSAQVRSPEEQAAIRERQDATAPAQNAKRKSTAAAFHNTPLLSEFVKIACFDGIKKTAIFADSTSFGLASSALLGLIELAESKETHEAALFAIKDVAFQAVNPEVRGKAIDIYYNLRMNDIEGV